jgi:vanillate O-demethylase ferredoxin subunit
VTERLNVRVHLVRTEAEDARSLELRAPDGADLPPFTAGAHLDVHLPGGMSRSYSLTNPQSERHRYVITVNRDAASRGGSRHMCEVVRPGEMLQINAPSNTFQLREDAEQSVLLAGGIGITPLWCMIQRLEQLGKPWRLYYAARTRPKMAFLGELQQLEQRAPGRVTFNFDHEPGATMFDIAAIVREQPPSAHLYCCGPTGMLKAFEAATQGRAPETVHLEYFTSDVAPAQQGGFEVVLARSKKTIRIEPGQTILQAVLALGMNVPRSCTQGVCGTCDTAVLEGIPDHRDTVLSKRERESNKKMMICCSGSLSERLVLDL